MAAAVSITKPVIEKPPSIPRACQILCASGEGASASQAGRGILKPKEGAWAVPCLAGGLLVVGKRSLGSSCQKARALVVDGVEPEGAHALGLLDQRIDRGGVPADAPRRPAAKVGYARSPQARAASQSAGMSSLKSSVRLNSKGPASEPQRCSWVTGWCPRSIVRIRSWNSSRRLTR